MPLEPVELASVAMSGVRGRGIEATRSVMIRAGLALMISTRSAENNASSTSWVMNITTTLHDLAVTRLMKQLTNTIDPRSYLITAAVTASEPVRAARLANSIASEYLRGRLREQATEACGRRPRNGRFPRSLARAKRPISTDWPGSVT